MGHAMRHANGACIGESGHRRVAPSNAPRDESYSSKSGNLVQPLSRLTATSYVSLSPWFGCGLGLGLGLGSG